MVDASSRIFDIVPVYFFLNNNNNNNISEIIISQISLQTSKHYFLFQLVSFDKVHFPFLNIELQ